MPSKRPEKVAYWNHYKRAKRAGIEFLFSFDEWCDWWASNLGPDWMLLRGCKKWHFVMARKGDAGSYHADNVDCITCSENNSQAVHEQTCQPRLTLDQVKEIKGNYLPYDPKNGLRPLARRFGVGPSTIQNVVQNRSWKHVRVA